MVQSAESIYIYILCVIYFRETMTRRFEIDDTVSRQYR